MSGYTSTQAEVLWACAQAGTEINTFTTETSLHGGLAPCILPGGYFLNIAKQGGTLRGKFSGQMGQTGTPSWTWTLRLLTTTTWSAGGLVLGSTAAVAGAATIVRTSWFLDFDIVMRNIGPGATSIIATMGEVRAPNALASPFSAPIPAAAVTPLVSTFDNTVQYYPFLSVACSASSSLNLMNIQMGKLYGEN